MHLPCVLHGEVGGTKEEYGPGLGIESLSRSPFSLRMWEGGCEVVAAGRQGMLMVRTDPNFPFFGGGGGEKEECVPLLTRVGACTDELRLMRGERGSTLDGVSCVG